jgi:hypothetical protein
MDRWIDNNLGWGHFLVCMGSLLSVASVAQELQSKPSEEPVVTVSPDPRELMKVGFINPRGREVTKVPFAKPGDTGTARIQACTDVKGRITRAVLKDSSGNPRVDAIATAVVSLSQFTAGIVKGKPKAGCTVLPITVTAPATAAEIASLPEPWKGGTPPTVGFVPSIPSSGNINQSEAALTQVCVDGGGKNISVTLAMPTGDRVKDDEILDLVRQFQISPAVVDGKRVASCLMVPLAL